MMMLLDVLDMLGRVGLPVLLVPLAAWTLLYPPVRGLLRSRAFAHPDACYYGHLAWLASLPLSIAVAAWIQATGVHPPQVTLAVLPPVIVGPQPAATEVTAAATLTLWHALGGLVLLGGVVALVQAVRLIVRWRATRMLRTGTAAPAWLDELAAAWRQRLGIRRTVRVVVAPGEVVPMTVGLRRPVVVLPHALLDDREALTLALTHELIHVVRFDDAAHAFESMVGALFSWHPGVRRLCHDLPGYRELACDAAVLALHRHQAKPYASLLLRFATRSAGQIPAAVSMADSPNTLKTRIQAMKAPSSASPHPRRMGLGLGVILLGIAGLVVACTDVVSSQDEASSASLQPGQAEVFAVVDQMPELIGGIAGVTQKIEYPQLAKEAGIEGRVIVQFTVDTEGKVQDAEVVRGIGGGGDEEALRVVQTLEFVPGRHEGKPVDVKLSLPITFRLHSREPETSAQWLQLDDLRQNGARLTGQILARAGVSLAGANVSLEGTMIGAATDHDGRFVINGVPEGEYTLIASLVGYRTLRQTVYPSTAASLQLRMQEQVHETGSIELHAFSE